MKTNLTLALLVSSVSPVDAVHAMRPMGSMRSKIAKLLVSWDGASKAAWIAAPPPSQRPLLTAALGSLLALQTLASRNSLLEHLFDQLVGLLASFEVDILHGDSACQVQAPL